MKLFSALILFALTATFSANASNLNSKSVLTNDGFTEYKSPSTILNDIPLMKGLYIAHDKALLDILPTPSNEEISAEATGIVDVDEIYYYYQEELPRIGWKSLGARDYIKDNKTLSINARANGRTSTVTFIEKPLQ